MGVKPPSTKNTTISALERLPPYSIHNHEHLSTTTLHFEHINLLQSLHTQYPILKIQGRRWEVNAHQEHDGGSWRGCLEYRCPHSQCQRVRPQEGYRMVRAPQARPRHRHRR